MLDKEFKLTAQSIVRDLESENNKLKRLLADKLLEVQAHKGCPVKEVVEPAQKI